MKRYVTEFANDVIKKGVTDDTATLIRNIIDFCKQGYITDAEAVCEIAKACLGFE